MRALALLILPLAAVASAQTLVAPEASVLEALAPLRPDVDRGLALRLVADETYLGRTVRTEATARWINRVERGRDVLRAEFMIWTDGVPNRRVVSDGVTVWTYEYRRNSYSALPIDRRTGDQANTYRLNAESALAASVGGPAADLVRLAREIAGGGTVTHRAWIPGVRPIAGRNPGQERWAIYSIPSGTPRSVVFEIADVDGVAVFNRVRRAESVRVGRAWRETALAIELLNEPVFPNSPAFVFLPPPDAVSVPARAVRF